MNKSEQAAERFEDGFNCSQAVLVSYCQEFGLDQELGSKIATAFGGGMHLGSVCGVVTGAFIVLGLKYGNTTAKDKQSKMKTYKKTTELANKFKARNDTIMCKQLLGCDITTSEGMKQAQVKGLFDSVCPKLVRDAADILEEMLAEDA